MVGTVIGHDMDMGLRIAVAALFLQLRQNLGRIASAQERPGVAPTGTFYQSFEIAIEPYRNPLVEDERARIRIDEGAAAGCDHARFLAHQTRDDPPFTFAEIGFAMGCEYLRHGTVGGAFDLVIDIDEGAFQRLGQAPPDSRLADTHQPDQHDRPIEPRREAAGRCAGRCCGGRMRGLRLGH